MLRAKAFFIDLSLIAFLVFPFGFIFTIIGWENLVNLLVAIGFILTIFKDNYSNFGSFGKRRLGLELEFKKKKPRTVAFLKPLRNLTLFIWPIEVMIVLITKGKRLGDLITASSVMLNSDQRGNS